MRTTTIVLAGALLAGCAALPPPDLRGTPAPAQAAQRTIVIEPGTRWANVTGGETIRFVVGASEFGWNFDGPEGVLELREIAPPGLLTRSVPVYVAPNPLYARRR